MIGKADILDRGPNPRFIVTSLAVAEVDAATVYERIFCACGEMENRIKEQQLYLFADRTSARRMAVNQLRLWLSSIAYLLLDEVRRTGLAGTARARARCDTIGLKLLKIGARVTINVRRIACSLSSSYHYQEIFVLAAQRLALRRHAALRAWLLSASRKRVIISPGSFRRTVPTTDRKRDGMRSVSMLRFVKVGLCLAVTLVPGSSVWAQATRTWVSGVGDDANPCSRTAPCKTFAGAISKTAAGGEISVLDPGGFGAVTITKSISIIASDSGEGGLLAAGTNGVVINAGAADVVTLRGLIIEGAGTGLNGIRFLAGKALNVENCVIADFRASSAGNGHGISFRPSGASQLYVVDTVVENNGIGSTGGGILIQPTSAGSAAVVLNRVSMPGNVFGLKADGTGNTGGIKVTLDDTVASSSTFSGIVAITPGGGAAIDMFIDGSVIANNGSNGIRSEGAGARVRLSDSTITGNAVGLSIAGGTIVSFSNNRIKGNVVDGVPNGGETEN